MLDASMRPVTMACSEARWTWRKSLIRTLLGLAFLAGPGVAATQPKPRVEAAPKPSPWPTDRILAVVDEDPILASDVRQVIALGIVERQAGEEARALWRRVLDMLIEQRLRYHDLDRFGFADVPPQDIEKGFDKIRAGFPSTAAFEQRLREVGLSAEGLHQLVARQLMVYAYVEERLGARVFVSLDDISTYYRDALAKEMTRQGKPLPPLDDVREQIRAVLREQRLLDEIRRWTADLRKQADVIDHFDSVHPQLPPVVYEVPPP